MDVLVFTSLAHDFHTFSRCSSVLFMSCFDKNSNKCDNRSRETAETRTIDLLDNSSIINKRCLALTL